MTKKETIKFLKRKKLQLTQNTIPPHEILKWLRVMKHYLGNLFGVDSEIYKITNEHEMPNIMESDYQSEVGIITIRMAWILEDSIELVESGVIDDKFDKNFIYAADNGTLVAIGLFIISTVFYTGHWIGSRDNDKEIKVLFSERPQTPIISTFKNPIDSINKCKNYPNK